MGDRRRMTRSITPIIIAGALLAAAGCGSSNDDSGGSAPAKAKTQSAVPYGTYVRQMTKADLARTAKLRDEAGPDQEAPPPGRYSLVIAKGAGQDIIKATSPDNFTVAMDLDAKNEQLALTSYVNAAQG